MASYSYFDNSQSTTQHHRPRETWYSSLANPRDGPRPKSSYASLAETSRLPYRDRHSKPHLANEQRNHARPIPRIRTAEEYQIDMACRWWNDHLKPTCRRDGWIKFRLVHGVDWGFIPAQYIKGLVNPSSPKTINLVVNHVLLHGQRGTHYAIGWQELYHLLRRFGRNDNLQPGDAHPTLSYHGPSLPPLELPQQMLVQKESNVQVEPPLPIAMETNTGESESEQAKEERCNRMVMIGFWESRRLCLPSLYDEKFPNGIDNAIL